MTPATIREIEANIQGVLVKLRTEKPGTERYKDLEILLKGWEAQRDRLSTKQNT